MSEHVLIELGGILILGILSQWIAWRLRFPSIFLLLVVGFVAGPLTGVINPDVLMGDMLLPFVSLSVAVILFEGGLTLDVKELKEIGGVVLALISVGVIITWVVGAFAAYYLLDLNLQVAILLAAILVVTGPTVIGPLLRQIRPSGKVADILKWEGIIIDPVGALLAVLVFEGFVASGVQGATTSVLLSLGKTILFGGLSGLAFAALLVLMLRKFWIPDFLQESMTLSLVIAAYLVADSLQHESGLFATTLMGIVLANQKSVSVKHILEFKENLRVLIISILFIVLAGRLNLDVFSNISLQSVFFLGVLMFVARPLSVFISTLGSKLSVKEKLFLSWMAPRGIVAAAVSSLFALRMQEMGIEQANLLVPLTFIIIVGTVAIYGLTAAPLARGLKLAQSNPQGVLFLGARPLARAIAKAIQANGFNTVLVDRNRADVSHAHMENLTVVYGNMLSKYMLDTIPFQGIGKLLAFTPNSEANSLALFHFDEVFNREERYQVCSAEDNEKNSGQELPKHLKGRILFGNDLNLSYLEQLYQSGWNVKSTRLTIEFDYETFKSYYKNNVIPFFLVTKDKHLIVKTTDIKFEPKSGQTIIALVKEIKED
jgi:NhaP-type Na+/H+ or K+/H+ antiporter